MVEPAYQELKAADIPKQSLNGVDGINTSAHGLVDSSVVMCLRLCLQRSSLQGVHLALIRQFELAHPRCI
jgi:hypothetical protein